MPRKKQCQILYTAALDLKAIKALFHWLNLLTNIGNEPDDFMSMARLMLYANQIDIEGLIASTSVHQSTRVSPELIEKVIHAYGKVQPKLLKHEPGFPTEQKLLSLVKRELPVYGMEGVGKGKDSKALTGLLKCWKKLIIDLCG